MPEEILSEHPERLRAVYVNGCNPLRSYPDTTAYEKAFDKLDLLVVCDIVLSETAKCAHYILPCRNGYESSDGTFFPWTYPEIYLQMRQPLAEPSATCREASQIFTAIADELGIIPEIPEDVQLAANGNRLQFGAKLMAWAAREPAIRSKMTFILAKTLGDAWNSANKATLWGMLMTAPPDDIRTFGLRDGQQVRVTTEAGSEVGELEMSDEVRQGTVIIPHGFGLVYEGGEVYGINVNRLTKNSHRDPLGTPLHRYVPCRVEAV